MSWLRRAGGGGGARSVAEGRGGRSGHAETRCAHPSSPAWVLGGSAVGVGKDARVRVRTGC